MLRGRQTGEKKIGLAGSNFQFAHIKPVVGLLKMSFTIKSLKNAMPRREIAKDLPSFNYENVELREQIGHGAYGMVCKGKYNKFNNEVVRSKIDVFTESRKHRDI